MKKLFISILAIALGTVLSFASDEVVIPRIQNNFRHDFAAALNVEWKVKKSYVEVSFVEDEDTKVAYYSFDGELIGTSRIITLNELPKYVKRSFAKSYSAYNLLTAHVFNAPDQDDYYLTVTNGKETLLLKASGGSVSVFGK